MRRAKLRAVDGSTALTLPPEVLHDLGLSPGSRVSMRVEEGCLIVKPLPHYTLAELLAQCDFTAERSK